MNTYRKFLFKSIICCRVLTLFYTPFSHRIDTQTIRGSSNAPTYLDELYWITWPKLIKISHSVLSNSLRPHGLYSPAGYSVHGILQARILEWVVISFSRGSSQSRDWTWVTYIAGGSFTLWATRKAQCDLRKPLMKVCKLGDCNSFTDFLGSDPS